MIAGVTSASGLVLRRPARRGRQTQAGQTLILALAFIAFFGVTVVAVLRVADLPGQQHQISEATASTDAGDEGGAAYAAADASRSDITLTCAAGNAGQLTMQNSGHKANYSVTTCNPSGSSGTGGGGPSCLLCLLNQTPIPPATATTPATTVFTTNSHGAVTTTGGNDYINGSLAGTLTATPAGAQIYVLNGASTAGCACSPAPLKYDPIVLDPLASLGAPSPVADKPTGCPAWTPSTGCVASYSSPGTYTVNPGLWASLSVSGKANVTFAAGTYVFSGPFSASGQGNITGTSGVTLYLACAAYGTTGAACPSSGGSRTGGSISITGNGMTSFMPPASGAYNGVVVLADPNLLDPGGVSGCVSSGSGCLMSIGGNGATFSGSQDLRSGGAFIGGNGGETISSGRFIANSLTITISGGGSAGLNLSGTGAIGTATCGVFDDSVSSTGGPGTGRAIIQSQCGTAKGVIDFNYSP